MPSKKDSGDFVYLDHGAFSSREEACAEYDSPSVPFEQWLSWNIWQLRAVGWGVIDGSTIYRVASWPEGGKVRHRVMARATASNVWHGEKLTWPEATRQLARWAGEPVGAIRSNEYTLSKKNLPGPFYVLAYQLASLERVDFALPNDVIIGRNGWARVPAAKAAKWPGSGPGKGRQPQPKKKAGKTARRTGGQGRLDKAARDAVEEQAMAAAEDWCRSQGWTAIVNTSKKHPWDLQAVDASGAPRYIEVKGTTGRALKFDVTAGEVKAARRHKSAHSLVAVTRITLTARDTGGFVASGGVVRAFDPWLPKDAELVETRYTWERPSA